MAAGSRRPVSRPASRTAAPGRTCLVSLRRDVTRAAVDLLLAARALGIGSTITSIGGIHEEDVHRLLGIPDGMDATCCIPLGWPEGKFGPARRKPLTEIAFVDHFGTPGPWSSSGL